MLRKQFITNFETLRRFTKNDKKRKKNLASMHFFDLDDLIYLYILTRQIEANYPQENFHEINIY